MKKTSRPMTQGAKRTLTLESAILVLDYYAQIASGQREVLAHFKGTEHKITQPKLTALIHGRGFKDWEKYPHFIDARDRARAKADSQNLNGADRITRTPDASKPFLQFDDASPSDVYAAKLQIDEAWCKFAPAVRELAAAQAGGYVSGNCVRASSAGGKIGGR